MIRRVGRYELHDELAAGGMGSVHLGLLRGDHGFSRVVAIKQMHPHLAGEGKLTSMFLEEARLAERIRHANVVTTLDVVADGQDIFIVMELVVGQSLRRLLADGAPVPSRIVAALTRDVLRGLHAVHTATSAEGQSLGLVHRDVSPHNILVAQEGTARLLDFGVAKATRLSLPTPAGSFKGKLAYIAPEQLRGEQVEARGDLFGLGVTAWEALTGRRLFRDSDDRSTLARVLSMRVPPPSAIVEGVDPVLERVIMAALERTTEARFGSAEAMGSDLETAPRADEGEVSRWLEARAAAALGELRARVREVERGQESARDLGGNIAHTPAPAPAPVIVLERADSTLPTVPGEGEPAEDGDTLVAPPPPARRSRGVMIAAGAAFILAFGMIAMNLVLGRRMARSEPAPAAVVRAPAADAAPPEVPDVAVPAFVTPGTTRDASPPDISPPMASASVSATSPTRSTHSHTHHGSHTAPCDPPYDLDADGIKHWKRACLP